MEKIGDFQPKSCRISETVQDRAKVSSPMIGSRTHAFNWSQNLWMTLNSRTALIVRLSELTEEILKKMDP